MNRKLFVVSVAAVLGFLVATNPVVAEAARQITGADIKNNSVTTADIKNKSLLAADFKTGQLPAGATGAAGAAGAAGPQGPQGAAGSAGPTGDQGVVRVNTVSGSISAATELNNNWTWLGPNTTVAVTDTDQLLTATANLPIATSTTTTPGVHETRVAIDFCYQPTGGGTVSPMRGEDYSIFDLSDQRISYGVTSFGRLPLNTYTIGVCGRAVNVESLAVNNTDYVNGYITVVNAPASSGSTPAPLASGAKAALKGTAASNRASR